MHKCFEEVQFQSAADLWEELSPTKTLDPLSKFIYRGQADANWQLIPSLLREQSDNFLLQTTKGRRPAPELIFWEVNQLQSFVSYCDDIGIKIPNDSIAFRQNNLADNAINSYTRKPSKWPDDCFLELMAMAQHHGVPTRLLDWTKQPYVSTYFAASEAIKNYKDWSTDSKLAIWRLDLQSINLYPGVKLARVPGSTSSHLSAQSGLFTVQMQEGDRNNDFVVRGLEEEFSTLPNTPLEKFTIPCTEATALFDLCIKAGINAATIYRTVDGAGKATRDDILAHQASEYVNENF